MNNLLGDADSCLLFFDKRELQYFVAIRYTA